MVIERLGPGGDFYGAGGARGTILRGTTRGTETTMPEISNWLTDGTISTLGEGVAIAVPVAEQIGQTWESSEGEFRSTQQCNCAAKRMLPRRRGRQKSFFAFSDILTKSVQLMSLMVHPKSFQWHQLPRFRLPAGTACGLHPGELNDRNPGAGPFEHQDVLHLVPRERRG